MEILKSPDLWLKTVRELGVNFFDGKASRGIGKFFTDLGILSESTEEASQADNSELSKERAIAKSLMAKFDVTPVTSSKILDLDSQGFRPG